MTGREPTPGFIGGGAPLDIRTDRRGDVTVIAPSGELDRETGVRLADAITTALASTDGGSVEIDLSGVRFMDSQGLRILFEAATTGGPAFRVVNPSDQVRRLVEITGTAEFFGL